MPKRKQVAEATPIMKRPAAATETGTQAQGLAEDTTEDAIAEDTSADKGKKTDLDERIAGFKKFCSEEGDASARGEYLKKYFKAAEMKALWDRLKTMRARASGDAKVAWNEIEERNQREGKREEKDNYLAAALTEPERWQQVVISRSISLTRLDKKGSKSVGLYMGELIQKHGYQEAMDFIKKGKYKSFKDAQGDVVYKKTQIFEESSVALAQTMGAQGQSQGSMDDWNSLAQQLAMSFGGTLGSQSPGIEDKNIKKRPASAALHSSGTLLSDGLKQILGDQFEEEETKEDDHDDGEAGKDEEAEEVQAQDTPDSEEKDKEDAKSKALKMLKALGTIELKIDQTRNHIKATSKNKHSSEVDKALNLELENLRKQGAKFRKVLQYKLSRNDGWTLKELKDDIIGGAELIKSCNAQFAVANARNKATK